MVKRLFALVVLMSLMTACEVTMKDSEIDNPLDPGGSLKPVASDFKGVPMAFAGEWNGPCSWEYESDKSDSCMIILKISQTSTTVSGSMTTVLSGHSSTFIIPTYYINGNDLQDARGNFAGRIGSGAIAMDSNLFDEFTIRKISGRELGVRLVNIPGRPTQGDPEKVSGTVGRSSSFEE